MVGFLSVQGPHGPGSGVVFEGARLITGQRPRWRTRTAPSSWQGVGSSSVGQKGELAVPPGAKRVDLTGKTVIPALVNAHVHLGYDRGLTYTVENFTREHLIAQLATLRVRRAWERSPRSAPIRTSCRSDCEDSRRWASSAGPSC